MIRKEDLECIQYHCNKIAGSKTMETVNNHLIEEIVELVKPICKLKRYIDNDKTLNDSIEEIEYNIHEELADVIIMLFQFIYINQINEEIIADKIAEKLLKYYETIND